MRARERDPAAAILVPGEPAVEVSLVADLEGGEVTPADAANDRAGLGGGQAGPVRGEVDADDELGPGGVGEGARRAQPALRDAVVDPAGRHHTRRRPPRLVAAVAADPEHGRLSRVEVLDQRDEDRVDRARVAAGVDVQGADLDREPEKAGRQGRPRGLARHLRGHDRKRWGHVGGGRASPQSRQGKRECCQDPDAPCVAVHAPIVAHAPGARGDNTMRRRASAGRFTLSIMDPRRPRTSRPTRKPPRTRASRSRPSPTSS